MKSITSWPTSSLLHRTKVCAHHPGMESQNQNLTCVICLERFRVPVTIPCGHTFCHMCIELHWNTQSKADHGPQCPMCNESFPTRPILKRNVSLSSLAEAANSTGSSCRESVMGCGEVVRAVALCDCHKKPLVYYCKQDKMSVCCECAISECKNHEKVMLEVERENQEVSSCSLRRDSLHIWRSLSDYLFFNWGSSQSTWKKHKLLYLVFWDIGIRKPFLLAMQVEVNGVSCMSLKVHFQRTCLIPHY